MENRTPRTVSSVLQAALLLALLPLRVPSQEMQEASPDTLVLRYGRLIPASSTMATAWTIPRDPLRDSTLGSPEQAELIRQGYRIFMATPTEAPAFTGNKVTCGNCHLNGGQREKGMPLVGVANVFPEFNKREGRMFTLEDRIIGCFMRSENAAGTAAASAHTVRVPQPAAREVRALAAYITYLSQGIGRDEKLPWRGENRIADSTLLPLAKLSAARGKELFRAQCVQCHGEDGQGVPIGDKQAGPLWGPASWNDGAGAARVYTLAGIIRHAMPYLNPGSLTDQEAQDIAFFITSQPRPAFLYKAQDYRTTPLPPDAVYYRGSR